MRKMNNEYLHFIRYQKCAGCLTDQGVEAHHVRSRIPEIFKGGTGLKPSDYMAIPLCHRCHMHEHGKASIEGTHQIIINLVKFINILTMPKE